MKKSILVLIAVIAISFSSFGQEMENKYTFVYASSYKTETFYISNIISERFEESKLSNVTDCRNQWHSKFKATAGKEYTKYNIDVWLWNDDIRYIEKQRNKQISYYKGKGYKMVSVTDFKYYKN